MPALLPIAFSVSVVAFGWASWDEAPRVADAQAIVVNEAPRAVTLYRGRASVTRSHAAHFNPGVYDLRFEGLPQTIVPQTIQAHVDGAARVLGVEFESRPTEAASSPEALRLDQEIERLEQQLLEIADQVELIKSEEAFIESVSVRATTDASERAGTDELDLDAVKKQLKFVTEERARLLKARQSLDATRRDTDRQLQMAQARRKAVAGSETTSRTAVVSIAVTESSDVNVDLAYLVSSATWEPVYNVRVATGGSTCQIEYDAAITQRTGEDWNDIALTLSTAQPTLAANPPELQPWFVDVRTADHPASVAVTASVAREEVRSKFVPADRKAEAEALKEFAADAEVGGGGPSVTFQLPRRVTVKSDSQDQQRTRVATIDTVPRLVHVAQPMLADAVYLRGDLTNTSAYLFLPGKSSVFIGQDYVGPTSMMSVAPGGEFKVFFGVDETVKANRQLIEKKTETTGLLGGGRRTNYTYRITVSNGSGRPITLELRDRVPVSRSDQIQIEVADVSTPLATDAYYTTEEKPLGILKWWLSIPAGARDSTPYELTYSVRVNRSKDVDMTPLPE